MEKKSKVGVGLVIGLAFLFALSLFAGEALAQAKPEGTLRVTVDTLGSDEGFLADVQPNSDNARMFSLVYDTPFWDDQKTGKLIPGLALSYEYSKDGMTFTLVLREGVPWHDSEKWGMVTAEDFKYTYERLMGKDSMNQQKKFFQDTVKSIEVVSPYKVVFHLKERQPEFWSCFNGGANPYLPIYCKKYRETVGDDKAAKEPIGSGPYRLVEHKAGAYLKFEALEKHWRVVPEFKYVIVQAVPEESTRVAMLKSGDTDAIPISAQSFDEMKNIKGIRAEIWPGGYIDIFPFGGMLIPKDKRYKAGYHMTDPWKDKRVRQAMNLAIDRKGIVKSIYKGAAKPATINYGIPGWDKLPPIPYDPKRAKELLAEAGYPDGFEFTLFSATDLQSDMPQVVEVAAANFKAIGLRPKIKMVDTTYRKPLCNKGEDVGVVYNMKASWRDVFTSQLYDKMYPGGNTVYFSSDELCDLIDAFAGEMDQAKRDVALGKIRDYLYNEWTTIAIVMANPAWAVREEVVGEFPKGFSEKAPNLEYIRHATPLKTWRLFTPGQ